MKKNILHNKSIEEFHTDLLSGKTSIFEVAEEVVENYNHSEASKSAFVEFNNEEFEKLASRMRYQRPGRIQETTLKER